MQTSWMADILFGLRIFYFNAMCVWLSKNNLWQMVFTLFIWVLKIVELVAHIWKKTNTILSDMYRQALLWKIPKQMNWV